MTPNEKTVTEGNTEYGHFLWSSIVNPYMANSFARLNVLKVKYAGLVRAIAFSAPKRQQQQGGYFGWNYQRRVYVGGIKWNPLISKPETKAQSGNRSTREEIYRWQAS